VFRDLRAYVCTFENCEAGLFKDRSTWFNHETEHHRRQWLCLACGNKTFHTVNAFHAHLQNVHGYTDPELLLNLSASGARPLTEIDITECPMCDSLTESVQAIQNPTGNVVVPIHIFELHLANHHEQLAMFAVTPNVGRAPDADDESRGSGPDPGQRNEVSLIKLLCIQTSRHGAIIVLRILC
jgi:hypothetical protein